jgi:hypothetical protein
MTDIKNQLSFSRKEQFALIGLLFLMLLLISINLIPDIFRKTPAFSKHQLQEIVALHQQEFEALEDAKANENFNVANPDRSVIEQKLNPFPFNPNNLAEESWKKLGLTTHQIHNIKNYESKGGKFFRKEDLKKIYTISETEYAILEPFIRIPSAGNQRIARASQSPDQAAAVEETVKPKEAKPKIMVVELNGADSLQLIQLPKVGPWFAHRILKYREILGGFVDKKQLREVYGMDEDRYSSFSEYVEVDTASLKPLQINFAEFQAVVRHPYFSYPLTKAVFNHRDRNGMLQSFDQLLELAPASDSLSPFLKYYVKF